MIRTGTAHYHTEWQARKAYPWDYEGAIKEGRIVVGAPKIKDNQKLVIDITGRYFIEEIEEK